MIDLVIVGYGKMGKMIESIINPKEFRLTGKYDVENPANENMKNKPDVAIEFSTPSSVIGNIEFLASKGVNIVCGTTGWYDKAENVKAIVEKYGTGLVYASNFSVGVNIFFRIVKEAAKLIDKYPGYSIDIEETHHTQKLDKPSGTAIRIADYLIECISRKDKFSIDDPSPSTESINIISKRIENAVGNHKVVLDSDADSIILEHNAKSRIGFAEGALLAAKFIHGKKGFYKFEDIFAKL
jgi:4-hydroxy-tetrahydrodipicolinate reductase